MKIKQKVYKPNNRIEKIGRYATYVFAVLAGISTIAVLINTWMNISKNIIVGIIFVIGLVLVYILGKAFENWDNIIRFVKKNYFIVFQILISTIILIAIIYLISKTFRP